ncbi:hypothetical protein [Bradyrhizobium sp. CCBAU 53421]|uniref:hypothetical protein n=1 Tax=Bradyrhizobium sp. CCBAU 53421 TaxID=1325120 RepID=UPI00188AB8C3|nr:hypothetical protein [Bradyrhizobium sp. CCBAU 53421]
MIWVSGRSEQGWQYLLAGVELGQFVRPFFALSSMKGAIQPARAYGARGLIC